MKRHWVGWAGVAILSAGFALGIPQTAPAQTRAERVEAASRRVKAALRREMFGEDKDRNTLLEMAREAVPDFTPALWQSGYVRMNAKWVRIDDLPGVTAQDRRFTAYRILRDKTPDTLEGQLELARWCAKNKLPEQARAHSTRVLEIDPNHAEARSALGYRLVNGEWLQNEEIADAERQAREAAKDLAAWRPRIENIRDGLDRRGMAQQTSASRRLAEIRDPAAIGAIELVLCRHSESAARLAVEALANFTAPEASLALARQAVFSPWDSVRPLAAEKLKGRDYHSFVPALLANMSTEIQSRMVLYDEPGGRMNFRQVFFRQGQDRDAVAVFDTAYRRENPADQVLSALDRRDIAEDATGKARARAMDVVRRNAAIRELNERISAALAAATGQDLNTPEQWWKWWNDHNEVFTVGQRPLANLYRRQEVLLIDPADYAGTPGTPTTGGGGSTPSFPMTYECLLAGTPVWTDSGPAPVESIKVGDLVLSQQVDTGELAYKPVMRTTVRPPARLLRIVAGEESITASGGHPFWVAGQGWVKARDLRPRQYLHAATGTAEVRAVEPAETDKTYNLVVADFHTYFVGNRKVLSHDNTIRRPTRVLVPGLARE